MADVHLNPHLSILQGSAQQLLACDFPPVTWFTRSQILKRLLSSSLDADVTKVAMAIPARWDVLPGCLRVAASCSSLVSSGVKG